MDNKVKKLWLKALRSGKYKQGRGQLKTKDNKFCCLGILCDIHSTLTKNKWIDNAYFDSTGTLPDQIIDWAGLPTNNPYVKDLIGNFHSLAEFNDGFIQRNIPKSSFKEIANYIEKSL